MKDNQQSKEYKTPQFQFIRQDDLDRVFFAASGPAPVNGSLGSMSSTNGTW